MIVSTSSLNAAIAMSRALFQLARPYDNNNDIAQYYCGWINHPITNQSAINLPTMSIPISENANEHQLDIIFQLFIDQGIMDKSELFALQSAIIENRGKRIIPTDFLSLIPSFANRVMTDEEARINGWFHEVENN